MDINVDLRPLKFDYYNEKIFKKSFLMNISPNRVCFKCPLLKSIF